VIRRSLGAIVVVGLLSLASPALAQTRDGIPVAISPRGHVVEAHQAVVVKVKVLCPAGYDVLEAFVYVVQDGHQSNDGAIPVSCDGGPHKYAVRVPASQGQAFHRGQAQASAYVLVQDPNTGQTQDGQDTRDILIIR